MTDVKRCDSCGKVDAGTGWYKLEREDIRILTEPLAWHFCTDRCLAAWSGGRVHSDTILNK